MDTLEPKKQSAGIMWLVGFLIAGSINYFGQQFNKSSLDEFIILVVAIGAGYFYHRLKPKIGIKNGAVRAITTYIILFVVSAFLIGAGTGVADALSKGVDKNAIITGSTRSYFVSELVASCASQIPSNSGYTTGAINNYCTCAANGIADFTTMQDAQDFNANGGMSAVYRAKATTVYNTCKASL